MTFAERLNSSLNSRAARFASERGHEGHSSSIFKINFAHHERMKFTNNFFTFVRFSSTIISNKIALDRKQLSKSLTIDRFIEHFSLIL